MGMDPYARLVRAINRKSDLQLMQVEVTGSSGGKAEVTLRGETVLVPCVGTIPSPGTKMWMIVDRVNRLGLT